MKIYFDRIRKILDELRELVGKSTEEIAYYLEYKRPADIENDIPVKCFDDEVFDEYMFYDENDDLHLTENGLLEVVMTSNQYKALEFQNLVRPVVKLAKEEYDIEL